MNTRKFIVLIVCLAISNISWSLGSDPNKEIIGKWEQDSLTVAYEFTTDGKLVIIALSGREKGQAAVATYSFIDDKHIKVLHGPQSFTWELSISDEELKLNTPHAGKMTFYKGEKAKRNRETHRKLIIGKWEEQFQTETLDFTSGGTVIHFSGVAPFGGKVGKAGSYKFRDDYNIQLTWGNKSISREFSIMQDQLMLIDPQNNKTYTYYKVSELIAAVKDNNIDNVKTLINKGDDVNERNRNEETPLTIASSLGNVEVAKILIINGADVNAKRYVNSYTPLMYAAEDGNDAVVKLLIDNGADVNARDKWGRTALAIAKEKRHTKVIQLLE